MFLKSSTFLRPKVTKNLAVNDKILQSLATKKWLTFGHLTYGD
jgi:hypothetical protein